MAIFDNLFGTQPEYLSGLLGADEAEKLRKQAMTTGLVNSAIALIAQPRNQRFGSALPYIGRALMAGQQAGQGVYNSALQGLEMQQKIAELKRQQEARKAFDEASKNLYNLTPAKYQETQVSGGGFLPGVQQGEAPNFNVSQQYAQPTIERTMIEPERRELNPEALMNIALTGDTRVPGLFTGLKTIKEITTPEKRETQFAPNGDLIYKDTGEKVTSTNFAQPEKISVGGDVEAISLAEYDKPFSGLSMSERQRVNNILDQQKIARQKAGAIQLPPQALGLGTAGQNKVDEALLTSGDRLSQLNQIQIGFRPEYQTIPYKTKSSWVSLKDKFNTASPQEKANLQNYSAFRQDSVRQLNSYINEVTGAAIGQGEEADRIKAGVPNPGSGMFDGDSPSEFEAKLNNTVKSLKLAEARLAYIKRNGLAITNVKLNDMPALIRRREQEIIKANKLDPDKNQEHRNLLKQQLANEFGLVY